MPEIGKLTFSNQIFHFKTLIIDFAYGAQKTGII